MCECRLRVGHDIVWSGIVFSPAAISTIGTDVVVTHVWMCILKHSGNAVILTEVEVVNAIFSDTYITCANIQFACTLSWSLGNSWVCSTIAIDVLDRYIIPSDCCTINNTALLQQDGRIFARSLVDVERDGVYLLSFCLVANGLSRMELGIWCLS